MSYLIEMQTPAGVAAYVIADGGNREEALAHVQEQLSTDDDEQEIVVVAVHTVH